MAPMLLKAIEFMKLVETGIECLGAFVLRRERLMSVSVAVFGGERACEEAWLSLRNGGFRRARGFGERLPVSGRKSRSSDGDRF